MSDSSVEKFSMYDPRVRTENDRRYDEGVAAYFRRSVGTDLDKLRSFPKYVSRQLLSTFLAKSELFRHVLHVHGHIIECGVYLGAGLMTWGNLSAIHEPSNHIRRIVGFDTFEGFVRINEKDKGDNTPYAHAGGLATNAYDDLQECVRLYDLNRPIGHIPRVELVVGDALRTIPQYIQGNPHLVVAMLYLDFDLYEPTKAAIEAFYPRMPRGAVIVFDELGQKAWPGETQAVLETIGLRNLRIQRFPYASALSYAVLD